MADSRWRTAINEDMLFLYRWHLTLLFSPGIPSNKGEFQHVT